MTWQRAENSMEFRAYINSLLQNPDFLMTLEGITLENTVGKGENAGNQHFLPFPQCFLPSPKQISILKTHLFYRLQMLSIWTGLRFCCLVKIFKVGSLLGLKPVGIHHEVSCVTFMERDKLMG